ncbi:MAG: hypothetical protein QNK23_08570 [Crocinitomicaceae bacterium]|nr:hypothetical protein [Crocinitomicaceae bacterium]
MSTRKDILKEERIELIYNQFYSMINKVNHISGDPKPITFGINRVVKVILIAMVLIPGISISVLTILNNHLVGGIVVGVGTLILVIALLYDHKNTNYKVDKFGVKIDDSFYPWGSIEDLRLVGVLLYTISFISLGIELNKMNANKT